MKLRKKINFFGRNWSKSLEISRNGSIRWEAHEARRREFERRVKGNLRGFGGSPRALEQTTRGGTCGRELLVRRRTGTCRMPREVAPVAILIARRSSVLWLAEERASFARWLRACPSLPISS